MASQLRLLTAQAKALDDPLPCQRENPELWFSEMPADLELAKAYCRPCPLRRFCLAGAVERHEPHGVWGGEIFTGGAIVAQKRPRGRPRRQLSALGRVPASAGRRDGGIAGSWPPGRHRRFRCREPAYCRSRPGEVSTNIIGYTAPNG